MLVEEAGRRARRASRGAVPFRAAVSDAPELARAVGAWRHAGRRSRAPPTTASRRRSTCVIPTTTGSSCTPTGRASVAAAAQGGRPLRHHHDRARHRGSDARDRDEEPRAQAGRGLVMGHLHLHVGDIEQGLAFYRDLLGFEVSATSAARRSSRPAATTTTSASTSGSAPMSSRCRRTRPGCASGP